MFTGIIQAVGHLSAITPGSVDTRLTVNVGKLPFEQVEMGESISINGACMTVVAFDQTTFSVDVSKESLTMTTLGKLKVGSPVNLERAVRLSDRLGGHLVSGHVDGVGHVVERLQEGRSWKFTLRVPADLSRYIAHKGSVTVDGVSLTVNAVDGDQFTLQIIPHTLEETIFSEYQAGSEVNIEVDLIARYLERLMTSKALPDKELSADLLTKAGFIS